MRRFSNIDNEFMMNHELSLAETYVLEWMLNLPIWADKIIVSKTTIYFASKNKACEDLPMITTKKDTMYRYYKNLEQKDLIKNHKVANKDFIEILPKCSEWNSIRRTDLNPDQSGQESENKSDELPTNSISNNSISNNSDLFSQKEQVESIPKQVIKFLNEEKPGKTPFQMSSTNLDFVKSRIKDGFTLDDFKIVILHKIREWKGTDKTKKWIRPSTLFGTKFETYVVQAKDFGFSSNDGSDNFEYKPQHKAEML